MELNPVIRGLICQQRNKKEGKVPMKKCRPTSLLASGSAAVLVFCRHRLLQQQPQKQSSSVGAAAPATKSLEHKKIRQNLTILLHCHPIVATNLLVSAYLNLCDIFGETLHERWYLKKMTLGSNNMFVVLLN